MDGLNLVCGVLGAWTEDVFSREGLHLLFFGAREYFQTGSHFNFIINLKNNLQ